MNLHDYATAMVITTAALKKDPVNVKALYRRGVARNHMGLAGTSHLYPSPLSYVLPLNLP